MGLKERLAGMKQAGAGSPLPRDIVSIMTRYGRHRVDPYTSGEPGPMDPGWRPIIPFEVDRSSRADPRGFVTALAEVVVPVGGWAVYGGAELALDVMDHDLEHPGYRALFEGGLQVRRDAGVPWVMLNSFDHVHWKTFHEGEHWLPPRVPPGREAASITLLAVGEVRRIAQVRPTDDSIALFAARPAVDRYVMILETEEDAGRVRGEKFATEDLYDLYLSIGQGSLAHWWNDPEFEPFCQYLWPRL
jgi:hypothetical protein